MTKEFSSIAELKSIREQKSRLSERENELSSPILTDFSLIPELYTWFKELLAGMACPPNPESVTQRKKFLFIVLFLFAPSVLAGGRLRCFLYLPAVQGFSAGYRVSLQPNHRKAESQRTNQVTPFQKVRGILFNQNPVCCEVFIQPFQVLFGQLTKPCDVHIVFQVV